MLATKNFGKKSLNEIKEILNGMGLDFGMEFDEQGNPIPGSGGRDGADAADFEAATSNKRIVTLAVRNARAVRNNEKPGFPDGLMRHLKAHRKLGRTT